jgi:hypothetical protein
MPYKERFEKDELKILRFLNTRMSLSEGEKKHLYRLEKGYEGEVMFDLLTEKLPEGKLILNDLLLEVNGTKFQVDTTLIVQDRIHLFEVKNYDGDYTYQNGNFETSSNYEISNPFDQVKRCESLFRQLLQKLGYKIPVEGQVIFINPEFALYQAPKNQPYVLSTQLYRFMKKIIPTPSRLNSRHENLAAQLVSLHQIESPYGRIPKYEYDQLRKGSTCSHCHSFSVLVNGKELVCSKCGTHERLETAVLRSVDELKLLFPDKKITTKIVQEWCNLNLSKKVIRKILDNNYKVEGSNRWIYYE